MREDTDFIALYDELGLDSECSLAGFRQAYRRRVALLHPDHPGDSSDTSRLQRLNRMYAAAMEFHRLHGRLPGASQGSRYGAIAGARTQNAEIGAQGSAGNLAGRWTDWRYVLLAVATLAALYWLGAQSTTAPRLDPEGSADAVILGATGGPKVARVGVGMEGALVLQIQGTPLRLDGHRWHYGPSWIDFACGKVVDWYSSPLAPLKVQEGNLEESRQLAVQLPYRC